MVKGVSVKFKSYQTTVPALLKLIKLSDELKKHSKIILKPLLRSSDSANTPIEFVESVLKFCKEHKSPDAELLIAEGSDGENTTDMFNLSGYRALAEKYSVGLIDLNDAEVEEVLDGEFLRFQRIFYPKILMDAFIISLPPLNEDEETEIMASLPNMLGVFPSPYYKGFFTTKKSGIRKWPLRYSIHDILKCRMPGLAVVDASKQGFILAGQPLEIDKQSAKLLGRDWKSIQYLRLLDQSFEEEQKARKSA